MEVYKDLSVRRGKVIGRISLWLESYKEEPIRENEKQKILGEVEDISSEEGSEAKIEILKKLGSITKNIEDAKKEILENGYNVEE